MTLNEYIIMDRENKIHLIKTNACESTWHMAINRNHDLTYEDLINDLSEDYHVFESEQPIYYVGGTYNV